MKKTLSMVFATLFITSSISTMSNNFPDPTLKQDNSIIELQTIKNETGN